MDLRFYHLQRLLPVFFFSGSRFEDTMIKLCHNSILFPQKHKLPLFFTQRVEGQKLVGFKILVSQFAKLWQETFTLELGSCVVHMFSGFMTVPSDSKKLQSPLKTVVLQLSCCQVSPPLFFHYVLGVYIFIIHFSNLSLKPQAIPTLNY